MYSNVLEGVEGYEKIVDTLAYLGDGITLDFVVILAYKDRYDNRKSYYSEYEYAATQKYNDPTMKIKTIKRSIKGHLCFTIKKSGIRVTIQRSMREALENTLREADAKWFSPKSKVFSYSNNVLEVIGEHRIIMPLPNGYGIALEPLVLFNDGLYEKGCRMYLNDSSIFVDISIDTFKEVLDIVSKIDYYVAACAVLNSLPLDEGFRKKNLTKMDDGHVETVHKGLFRNNRAHTFFDNKENKNDGAD